MDSGAIVAVTTHGGAEADTATIQQTVAEAGIAVAELIAVQSEVRLLPGGRGRRPGSSGRQGLSQQGVLMGLADSGVRTYVAEPKRGSGTGNASSRRRWRYMATGGGSKAIAASNCSGNEASGSSGTSRTSSTPAGWIGCGCAAGSWRLEKCHLSPHYASVSGFGRLGSILHPTNCGIADPENAGLRHGLLAPSGGRRPAASCGVSSRSRIGPAMHLERRARPSA